MWSRTFGTSPRTPRGGGTVESMAPTAFEPVADRVVERRRAVALARHYREAEGLSIGQIADRLGRSPATIKAYFYDPTGEKAREVKARYRGVCGGCARRPVRATARGTPTPTASAATPERSQPGDSRTSARRDARLARPLRPPLLIRLVAHPLAVAGHPGRFGSRNAGPQAFPGTGPTLRDPPPPQDASARTRSASSQRPPHRSECR